MLRLKLIVVSYHRLYSRSHHTPTLSEKFQVRIIQVNMTGLAIPCGQVLLKEDRTNYMAVQIQAMDTKRALHCPSYH